MNTQPIGTGARRWWLSSALLAASCVATLPAFAANCSPNGYQVNPNNQNFQEYNAANSYAHTLVTLGVNKVAADGVVLSWVQTGGPAVTLNTSNPAAPTFLTPDVTASTILTFRLTATCPDGGNKSDIGTFTILNTNRPPVAYASAAPPIAYEGASILLNSTAPLGTPASSDPDGDTLFYLWTQTAGPTVTLANAGTATAGFTAPATGSAYTLQFQLSVSDRATGGLSSTAPVVVNISPNSLPPIAVLDCPEQVGEHGHVLLDGSTSSAGNGGTLSYAWSQIQGSPGIIIGNEASATVEFDAPSLTPGFLGLLEFHLLVTETSGASTQSDLAQCLVQIVDVTPPVVTVPADIVIEAASPDPVPVSFSAFAQDAAEDLLPYELPVAACAPLSGSLFALAAAPTKVNTTDVTCSASDVAGNSGHASFHVTVQDTTPPVMTVPGGVAMQATSPAGAVVDFAATTADAVDGPGTASCDPASHSTFALGDTPVTCNAADARENSAEPQSFTINVFDLTAPVITGASDQTLEATSPAGAAATFALSASDTVDEDVAVDCSAASGDTFPLGSTLVECTATDDSGNTAEVSFTITVEDTTAPVIAGAADQSFEATSPAGAVVTFAPTASDVVDEDVVVECTPASGSTFALGDTPVDCTATDDSGNTAEASFIITVEDTTAPVITGADGANQTLEATSPAGAVATFTLDASDIVDEDVAVDCSATSGDTFPLGDILVECSATDDSGNTSHASFTITVEDTTAPVIDPHGNEVKEATGPGGATVIYTSPGTFDLVDVALVATCSPASGSTFALGSHTVTCNATDGAGNAAVPTTFTVTVEDTTKPVIDGHGNELAEATGPLGAVVTYTSPGTFDVVDVGLVATCTPVSGSTFALGSHTVTCNATDGSGNIAAPTAFIVTVHDTTAPTITPHADVTAIASSNSTAVVSYVTPTATDLVDATLTVTCAPASGSTFNVGSTTVTCSTIDDSGNPATSSFAVIVSYSFTGFFRPVDNPIVVNVVKAGSAIPVKFSLGGNQGLNIFAAGFPASVSASCSATQADAIEETVTAGNSSLSYDAASNQYIYVWKTEKSWNGCRVLQVKLKDGSSRWATFSFTR